MMNNTTKPDSLQPAAEKAVDLFDNWFDPIETEVRVRAREFIEELLRDETRYCAGTATLRTKPDGRQ
jgi:putative transposase